MKYAAQKYADKFGCHVKTILRAVTGEDSPSDWDPDDYDTLKVAKAFGMDHKLLVRVMQGKENLVDATQAAANRGISVRRLHQLKAEEAGPKVAAIHGRIVRYAETDTFDI